MPDRPLVSIVTPSLNQAAFLPAAMQSVFAQTYLPIEYIVIDGGSTDGSAELIRAQAARLAYSFSEPDAGQADAINKGFAQASGRYYLWLNADDCLLPKAVAEMVELLERHPDVGLVYGDVDYIDAAGRVRGRFPARQTDYAGLLRGYVHIPQQASAWRAELWEPLDASLSFAMDYDLWVRIARRSRLLFVPRLWAQFRLHADSKTMRNDMLAWQDMLTIHQREGGGFLSIMRLKYWLRRLLFPLLRARRKRLAGV